MRPCVGASRLAWRLRVAWQRPRPTGARKGRARPAHPELDLQRRAGASVRRDPRPAHAGFRHGERAGLSGREGYIAYGTQRGNYTQQTPPRRSRRANRPKSCSARCGPTPDTSTSSAPHGIAAARKAPSTPQRPPGSVHLHHHGRLASGRAHRAPTVPTHAGQRPGRRARISTSTSATRS